VTGVTVPLNVVMNLDGVEFTVTAPLYIEVRNNMDNKAIVLIKHQKFGMFCIFQLFSGLNFVSERN
jgi:hypothetical protein